VEPIAGAVKPLLLERLDMSTSGSGRGLTVPRKTTRKDKVRIMKNYISLTIATVMLAFSNASADTLLVSPVSTNPVPPFTNWVTAATDIQQAVNAAAAGDDVVVTNGTYGAVNVDKPLLLRSVNGPRVTF